MTKQNRAIVILVVIAVVFSVIAFAVPFPKTAVFWIAYLAELAALTLQIPIFKMAFDGKETPNSKVLGFPVFRVGYIYLGVQTVLSLIFFGLAFTSIPVWIEAVLFVIVLGGAIVCSMAADIAREEVEQIEYKQAVDTSLMTELRTRSAQLVNRTNDASLKKQLESLAEAIRYSDPVSSPAIAADERKLLAAFERLEQAISANGENVSQVCDEVQAALKVRNAACKMNKS